MSASAHHDELKERYVRLRRAANHRSVAESSMLMLAAANVILFFCDSIVAQPQNLPLLHVIRVVTVVACLEYFPVARRFPDAGRCMALMIHIGVVAAGAFLFHRMANYGDVNSLAAPGAYFLTFAFLLTLGVPFNTFGTLLAMGVYIALGFYAADVPNGALVKVAYINNFALAVAGLLHVVLDRIAAAQSRSEISTRLRIAPLDIVRSATVSREDHLSFELPRQPRLCICLASDWRGYQALSRRTPPEALQAVLGAYYDMCRNLLVERFPAGNYFTDWIADELLIFFVAEDQARAGELAREVVGFARRLIKAKASFVVRHGIPHGIDIGLAAGRATVGLFGPRTNRKVMAVGRVAVDARNLQSLGKQLRLRHGARDRVLYDSDLHAMAGLPEEATTLAAAMRVHVDAPPVRVLYEEPGDPGIPVSLAASA